MEVEKSRIIANVLTGARHVLLHRPKMSKVQCIFLGSRNPPVKPEERASHHRLLYRLQLSAGGLAVGAWAQAARRNPLRQNPQGVSLINREHEEALAKAWLATWR